MHAPGELTTTSPPPIRVMAAVELGVRATFGDRMLLVLVGVYLVYGFAFPVDDAPGLVPRGPVVEVLGGLGAIFISGCVTARVLGLAPGWREIGTLVLARFRRLLVPFLVMTLLSAPLLVLGAPAESGASSPMLIGAGIMAALFLFVAVRWGMYEAVVLREDAGVGEALTRCWWLTSQGNWLRLLVVLVVSSAGLGVAFQLLGGVVGLVAVGGVAETVAALSGATISVALPAALAVAYAQAADTD
jgi:hypothetical protein